MPLQPNLDYNETVQSLTPGILVRLFIMDATSLGAGVYYFTDASENYGNVLFGGNLYTPIDMEADEFEWNGKGSLPTPHIKISNANLAMNAAVIALNDLIGAKIIRYKTFSQFLDNGETPDPEAIFPADIYTVSQKIHHNKTLIEWELQTAIDQQGVQLPNRLILRDSCTWIYRYFNPVTNAFDYTKATCPYTGTAYYDVNDNVQSNPASDQCGKRLSSCRLRFGQNGILPTSQFPGVGSSPSGGNVP